MVRLKVGDGLCLMTCRTTFNSTMVRLKELDVHARKVAVLSFNSTMVRLKDHPPSVSSEYLSSFNSTMVRLKASPSSVPCVSPRFQFHYGTIKSLSAPACFSSGVGFQFHYGTIKRVKPSELLTLRCTFNSTMVRLKEL